MAVANPTPEIDVAEVYGEIEKSFSGAAIYRLDSSKVSAAAIEIVVLLSVVGSIASVASLLWQVYDHTVGRKKKPTDDCGLYIAIVPEKGLHWWVGKEFLSLEDFQRDFTVKVERYLQTDDAQRIFERLGCEVSTDIWIHRR
jgi:hypothetical protein